MVESLENNYFGVVQFSKKVENEKTCIFLLKKKHSSLETNFLLIFCFVEIFKIAGKKKSQVNSLNYSMPESTFQQRRYMNIRVSLTPSDEG